MGRAGGLALAAAQAVLDGVGDPPEVGLLQEQRLGPDQRKARRVGVGEVAAGKELARVEAPLGVDLALVGTERLDLLRLQELELGDADAVLAGNNPAERAV